MCVPNFSRAIELLYNLKVGTTPVDEGAPHERPHKPLLLLAVLDLIDEGRATPDKIPWSQELRDRFSARFTMVKKHNDQNSPENPFFYLRGDGFWNPWKVEASTKQEICNTPKVAEFGSVFATFTQGFDALVATPNNRRAMREALVARYFPEHAKELLGVPPHDLEKPADAVVEDGTPEYGRDPAFRRKIIEIYDHQCAACGLRIRLPTAKDISFIDAAHLVPFAESRNDHPTNGLALCKNHHWAMDRHLIAPSPDMTWHVSKLLQSHRSNGEKELLGLAHRSILLPHEPAFHPDQEGLAWRLEKLIS